MPDPEELVDLLADWVLAPGTALRLAVDGPDAAGKTTLADRLAASLVRRGRPVVRASIDGFHRPREERYQRGELSPEGYYLDSFDLARLRSVLLDPLGPGGNRVVRTSLFDHLADLPVESAETLVPADAVLVFDGVFLQKPELMSCWDLVVFLEISEEEVLRRAEARDLAVMGPEVRDRYLRRYLPAHRIYRNQAQPPEGADVVVDNTDPGHPLVLKAPWQ
jgi:uridine kinase